MKITKQIKTELEKRAGEDKVSIHQWGEYISFLESCPSLGERYPNSAVHHILWRGDYPQLAEKSWNMIRLSSKNHTIASALMVSAEPSNPKLIKGLIACAKTGNHLTWRPKHPRTIVRLYTKQFWTPRRIGQKFGVSAHCVFDFLRRSGISTRGWGIHLRWSPKHPHKIFHEYNKGASANSLANRYGTSPMTLIRFLMRNGIFLRKTLSEAHRQNLRKAKRQSLLAENKP
jgi:hypothetical protein